MEILLSLITSGSIRYIVYLLLFLAGGGYLTYKHIEAVKDAERYALAKYNITQLEQIVKDKDTYIRQLEAINQSKSKIVADLTDKNSALTNKIHDIMVEVNKSEDRESSVVLKNTIRELEKLQ